MNQAARKPTTTVQVSPKALARLHAIKAREESDRGRGVSLAEVIERLLDNYEDSQGEGTR